MHPREELIPLLKKLRMSGVLETLELRVEEARGDEVSHHEFLVRLLRDEVERREAKQLGRRCRTSTFSSTPVFRSRPSSTSPRVASSANTRTSCCLARPVSVRATSPKPLGTEPAVLGIRYCSLRPTTCSATCGPVERMAPFIASFSGTSGSMFSLSTTSACGRCSRPTRSTYMT